MVDKPEEVNAQDVGFVAIDRALDKPLEVSGVPNPNTPGEIYEREIMENRKLKEARNAILEIGDMDLADLASVDLASQDPQHRQMAQTAMKMASVARHVVETGARQVVTDAYMNPTEASMMMEQEAYNPQCSQYDGWKVVKSERRLRSGKVIPVFEVQDSLTQIKIGKPYRIATVAEKIALVLNTTHNPNDSRIKLIENAYDEHVTLMRQKASATRSHNTQQINLIEAKLSRVNPIIGIS